MGVESPGRTSAPCDRFFECWRYAGKRVFLCQYTGAGLSEKPPLVSMKIRWRNMGPRPYFSPVPTRTHPSHPQPWRTVLFVSFFYTSQQHGDKSERHRKKGVGELLILTRTALILTGITGSFISHATGGTRCFTRAGGRRAMAGIFGGAGRAPVHFRPTACKGDAQKQRNFGPCVASRVRTTLLFSLPAGECGGKGHPCTVGSN